MGKECNVREKYATDEQTGKVFQVVPEENWDIAAATISMVYLVGMLLFFAWQLLELCTGRNLLLKLIVPKHSDYLHVPLFRLIAYTVIGGGLGGVVNGMRSILAWHAEREAFGRRYIWKYITLPLLGATLAAIVYAIVWGGIAAFAADFTPKQDGTSQALAAFVIGALAGYGSHKVFRWLDGHVNRLFKMPLVSEVRVPDLSGKSLTEAELTLRQQELRLGKVAHKVTDDTNKVDKVIEQNPPADSRISRGGCVDITIGKKK